MINQPLISNDFQYIRIDIGLILAFEGILIINMLISYFEIIFDLFDQFFQLFDFTDLVFNAIHVLELLLAITKLLLILGLEINLSIVQELTNIFELDSFLFTSLTLNEQLERLIIFFSQELLQIVVILYPFH